MEVNSRPTAFSGRAGEPRHLDGQLLGDHAPSRLVERGSREEEFAQQDPHPADGGRRLLEAAERRQTFADQGVMDARRAFHNSAEAAS
ncbi:hypothetical protein [Streptomyces sp. NPDC001070]